MGSMNSPGMLQKDQVNRLLSMLIQINRAIIRADSPDSFYLDACRIAVETGLFKFSWVGLINSFSQKIQSMASWSVHGDVKAYAAASDQLANLVHRSGELFICKDLKTAVPNDEAEDYEFQSVVGMPLREGGRVAGVFLLYTDQSELFDQSVIALLTEAADDLSFSLEHMLNEQRRWAAESKLHYRAFYDAQTGLPNRTLLEERLPRLAALAQQRGGLLTLLDIKLQRLDQLVQLLGNFAMDEVLRTLAQRLESCRGNSGQVAQLAPDEFAMVSLELSDSAAIAAFAYRVQRALAEAVRIGDKEIFLYAGIGVAVYPQHESDIQYLLRRARVAAERTSIEGGFRLYSPELERDLEQRMQMEADLHRALERSEFRLYYQPQLNLKTGEMVGVEALLRWQHPKRGLILPEHFISLLEECGLMPSVGAWVLRTACLQARAWQDQGFPPLRMAVNLSAQQFRLANLVSTVKNALDDAGLDARHLELELTESLILENVEQTIQLMHDLKQLGVSLSLDDFGTGYSSLSYLRRYPVDRIKIDQSFIRDMTEHASSAALVRSILSMAFNLGLDTISEGVETVGQFDYLRKYLCQEMQGYLFSTALPQEGLTKLLQEGSKFEISDKTMQDAQTLLVVDKDVLTMQSLQRVLGREVCTILTASDPDEGLGLMADHDIGVIVGDAHFLLRTKGLYPDAVRIMLADCSDCRVLIDAVNEGGFFKILSKPLQEEFLRKSILEAFRQRETRSQSHHDPA